MRITKTKLQEVSQVTDVICHKCAKSAMRWDMSPSFYGLEHTYTGGYMSGSDEEHTSDLQDCGSYQFAVCEDCLSAFFDTFLIPPIYEEVSAMSFGANAIDIDLQNKINKLYGSSNDEMALFLTDDDENIRKIAEALVRSREKP